MADAKRNIYIYINGKEVRNNVKDIRNEMIRLTNAQAKMTRGTKEYNEAGAEIKKMRKILADHNNSLRSTSKMWSTLKGLLPVASVAGLVTMIGRLSSGLMRMKKEIDGDVKRSTIVLGDQLGYVEKQAERMAKQMGLSNQQFTALVANTADLLVPLDFTRESAAKMSVELQSLTGALDEWTGGRLGAAEVSAILTKAMLGENEQLKQLGIAIRKDSDEFRDLVKLKMEDTSVTKAQAEAMATLELIQKKSLDAQRAYQTEGNRLLRFQKELQRQWRLIGEEVVGWMEIPAAKLLQEEADKANLLTAQLMNTNIESEKRKEIYDELKKLYPDILKGIDQENIDTKKLLGNLAAYNDEMSKKIVLANLSEEQQKILSDQAQKQTKLTKSQTSALRELNKHQEFLQSQGVDQGVLDSFDELRGLIMNTNNEGIDPKQLNTIYQTIWEGSKEAGSAAAVTASGLSTSMNGYLSTVENYGKSYRDELEKNKDALVDLADAQEFIMSSLSSRLTNEDDGDGGGGGDDDEAIKRKAAYDAYLYTQQIKEQILKRRTPGEHPIDWIFDEQEELPDDIPWLEEWTDNFWDQFDDSYEGQKALLDAMLESKLISAREYHQKLKELEKAEADETLKNDQERYNRQVELANSVAADLTSAMIGSWNQRKQAEITYNKAVQDLSEQYKSGRIERENYERQLADLNADRKKEEVALEKAKGKELLKTILEYLRKYAHAKIAEATIGSLASAESIATFGIAGVAKAALLTALVETAFGLAQAKISQSYADGKYPVTGTNGMTYQAGTISAPVSGIYSQPTMSLISENGPEMVVDANTVRALQSFNPEVIDVIEKNHIPRYADGKSSNVASSNGVSGISYASDITAIKQILHNMHTDLVKGVIYAKVDDYQTREIRDRIETITNIENRIRK